MWHAALDEIVPFADDSNYVKEQCAKGADISYTVFPIAEHISAELLGLVPGLLFLSQAYEGRTPKVVCGTNFPDLFSPHSSEADQVMGQKLITQIHALNGKTDAFGQTIHV
jgi:hypothetical protein